MKTAATIAGLLVSVAIFAAAALFVGQPAHAQAPVFPGGHTQTYIQPTPGGGFSITTPGSPPLAWGMPNGAGGYTVTRPAPANPFLASPNYGYPLPNAAPVFPTWGR